MLKRIGVIWVFTCISSLSYADYLIDYGVDQFDWLFTGSLRKPNVQINLDTWLDTFAYSDAGYIYVKSGAIRPYAFVHEYGHAVLAANLVLENGQTFYEEIHELSLRDHELSRERKQIRDEKGTFYQDEVTAALEMEQDELRKQLFPVLDEIAPFHEFFGDLFVELVTEEGSTGLHRDLIAVQAEFIEKENDHRYLCIYTQRDFFKAQDYIAGYSDTFDHYSAFNAARYYVGKMIPDLTTRTQKREFIKNVIQAASELFIQYRRQNTPAHTLSYSQLNEDFISLLENRMPLPRPVPGYTEPSFIGLWSELPQQIDCSVREN